MSNRLLYTALGDSITGGFGASFFYGFAYCFRDFLRCRYRPRCIRFNNFGCPGLTSCGLLKQLKCDREVRCSAKNSDIITITIGGNNLLKAACNNFKCINKKVAARQVECFARDWEQILYYIREELRSEAQIYVMNIYNPYCPNEPNYQIADYYVNLMNSVIEDPALVRTYGYSVVDAYSLFANNKCMDWTFFDTYFIRDPHPNWRGNHVIFAELKKVYDENNLTG